MKNFLSGLIVFALAAVAAFYLFFVQSLRMPGPLAAEKIIYIAPGTGTAGISEQLFSEDAVSSAAFFKAGAYMRRSSGSLKAGEYQIPARASMNDIIALIQSGKTFQRKLTIAEGLMSVEIVALLNAAPALEGHIDDIPADGSLLPETYNYTHGEQRQAILDRMKKSMRETLKAAWESRDPSVTLASPEEAVTFASIVEKETGVASERPRVAGVFYNRMKAHMPLQTDPTVIYALTMGKYKLERPLYRKDLDVDSPYNTYRIPGLPPGPIANPGKASINAVLHPETNDFYYFVADGSGGHAFGRTLEEHTRNVAKWRELQRKAQ